MAISDKNITSPDFWSNMAAEAVYNSAEKRTKSVEALKTIIVWAFALFSTGGFMLTLFGNLKEYDKYALYSFGFAFFLLTIGYMFANRALYPVLQTLNTNIIDDIKTALSAINKTQTNRFKWAAAITASGFFFLAFGIILEFGTVKKGSKVNTETTFYMKTGVEKIGDSTYIPVTIMNKKNESVTLSFINAGSFDSVGDIKKLLFSKVFYSDASGRLYYSYSVVNDSIKKVIVKATVKATATADTLIETVNTIKLTIPR